MGKGEGTRRFGWKLLQQRETSSDLMIRMELKLKKNVITDFC
jgi:hypothetical protein